MAEGNELEELAVLAHFGVRRPAPRRWAALALRRRRQVPRAVCHGVSGGLPGRMGCLAERDRRVCRIPNVAAVGSPTMNKRLILSVCGKIRKDQDQIVQVPSLSTYLPGN